MLKEILSQGRGLRLVHAKVKAINEIFGYDWEQPLLIRNLPPEDLTSHSSNVYRRHFVLALKEKYSIEDKD